MPATGQTSNASPKLFASSSVVGGELRVSVRLDADTLEAGLNFRFATRRGDLDVFGEPTGAPAYVELKRRSSVERIEGIDIRVASSTMGGVMEAAGRKRTGSSPASCELSRTRSGDLNRMEPAGRRAAAGRGSG